MKKNKLGKILNWIVAVFVFLMSIGYSCGLICMLIRTINGDVSANDPYTILGLIVVVGMGILLFFLAKNLDLKIFKIKKKTNSNEETIKMHTIVSEVYSKGKINYFLKFSNATELYVINHAPLLTDEDGELPDVIYNYINQINDAFDESFYIATKKIRILHHSPQESYIVFYLHSLFRQDEKIIEFNTSNDSCTKIVLSFLDKIKEIVLLK